MRRREFVAGLGSAAAWPLAAQTERTRRIGALMAFTEKEAEGEVRIAAFRRKLQETRCQSQDRESDRTNSATVFARPRRRGHRIIYGFRFKIPI